MYHVAIRRGSVPADNFTVISNAWLRDARLTWKAKGLLAYIASHAPGHQLTTSQIHADAKDGPDAVRAAVQELETAGYLLRVELRDERGHRTGTDYELREPPAGEAPAGESPTGSDQQEQGVSAAQNQSGKSRQGKPGAKKTTSQEDKKKTPSPSARGTRLQPDWMPSEDTKEWCRVELPAELYQRAGVELEKFRNYWCAKTGKDATKIEWDRTFRNWMINARDRYGSRPVSGPPAPQFKTAAEKNAEDAQRRLVRAKLAEEIREREGIAIEEAYRLAGERLANGLDTCTATGYIDGVIIDEARREVTQT